ncbi:MAG: glycosyltransferase family 39 protein [Acidimicrobiales bacterium]
MTAGRELPQPGCPGAPHGAQGDGNRAPAELIVLAVLAVLAGVVLRFVARSPMWLDEALSVNIAQLPLGEIPDALRHDGHPPLYYVLLHGWIRLFGTSDLAVRSLSGVFAVGTLPLAWLAGRRRGGPVLAWLALLVLALSPFALRYATEARMYALVMLLVSAGWLLVDGAVRLGHDRTAQLAAITLTTAALLYTHYWSLWLLGAAAALLVWRVRRGQDDGERRRARRVLVSLAVGGLLFIPWLPVLLDQSRHTGTPWSGPPRPTSILATTLTDFGGGRFRDAELVSGMILVLVLLAVFGAARDRFRIEIDVRTTPPFRAEAFVVAATLTLGAGVSYATWSAYATRYASVVFPLVMLLVAGGIARFADRWVRDGVALAMTGAFLLGAVYNVTSTRTQAGMIGSAVAQRAVAGDVVVYCPDQLGPAGSREMPGDLVQLIYPTLDGPVRVDWRDYEERNRRADPVAIAGEILRRAGPTHQIFVVWSGGYATFEGQCETLLDTLAAARPGATLLVEERADTYFEHAQLVLLPASDR